MLFTVLFIIIIVVVFAGLLLVLEYIRRRALEDIKARCHDFFLSYYTQKISDLCGGDVACKEYLSNAVANKLTSNISDDRISYVNIYEKYEEYRRTKELQRRN